MKLYTITILAVAYLTATSEAQEKAAGCEVNTPACCCAQSCGTTASSVSNAVLSEAEANHLLYLREEEKLARDVYLTLGEKYNQRVFVNIPRAEQFHMDAVLRLLEAYGLKDSAAEEPGRFNNPELQTLYDSLVKRGSASREEAFRVGAFVEEVDIIDLRRAISQTENKNITSILQALEGGSNRHLNAFVRNYEAASGKSYVAQKMTQQEVDAILGR